MKVCDPVGKVESVMKTDTSALYERFPHLKRLDTIWGTRDCRQYILHLMTDTRGGTRQGFPYEHAVTIMALLLEHDQSFPQFEHDGYDWRWGQEQTRRWHR